LLERDFIALVVKGYDFDFHTCIPAWKVNKPSAMVLPNCPYDFRHAEYLLKGLGTWHLFHDLMLTRTTIELTPPSYSASGVVELVAEVTEEFGVGSGFGFEFGLG
jgi:hypothetical protein